MSSFQDFTNEVAPSSWSFVARASQSTPALANWAKTVSQFPPSAGTRRTEFAVIGKGFQRTLWHRVKRKWCDQLLDVEDVGGFGIFGSSAGKQESLWAAGANRFPDGELAPPAHEQERRFAVFLKPGNLCVMQINFRRAPCSLNADFR